MDFINENIQYENPFLSTKIFKADRNTESEGHWHYHKEIELLAMLDGKLDIHVEDEYFTLEPGDVILLGSGQPHRDRVYADVVSRYYVLQFDIEYYVEQSLLPYFKFFTEPGFPLSRLNYIFKENEAVRQSVFESVAEIYKESREKQEGYEIAISLLIKKILLPLVRNDTRKLLQHRSSADLIRLKPVLNYIDEHISEKIQVEAASRIANVSYYYFVKFFKKALGMSFLEYVNYKKIKQAERYLLTKEMSISDVGEAIGIPNMAHFYKLFKKYNECSPNEYRKKMLEWSR